MPFLKKKNCSRTTLASGITAGATSMTVTEVANLPAETDFLATIWDKSSFPDPCDDPNHEIVKVTNINGSVLTITRAQEDTSASIHNGGHAVELLITAGHFTEIESAIDSLVSSEGDMTKSVYDTNANNIVDKSESIDDGTFSATASEIKDAVDHISLTNNPHSVTKTQVGLGNVPNLNTTDAVNNEHTQNTDTKLDEAGANEVSATQLKTLIDTTVPGKADKVDGATDGNLASLDENGNLEDSGSSASDFAPSSHNHDDIYLNKGNTTTFTPDSDYEPATKKYVDDSVIASLTDEEVQDIIGAMVSGNTETLISVTYDDPNGKLNFEVDNDLSNYDNSSAGFLKNIVEDTTPQLGGNLDGQSFNVTGVNDLTLDPTGVLSLGGNVNPGTILDIEVGHDGGGAGTVIEPVKYLGNSYLVERFEVHSDDIVSGIIRMFKSEGTKSTPAAVSDGSITARFSGAAYDGASYDENTLVRFGVGSSISGGSSVPGFIDFWTQPANGSWGQRMIIDQDGNIGIGTGSPETLLDVNGPSGFSGDLDVRGNNIVNLLDPTADQDAVTKKYSDDNLNFSLKNMALLGFKLSIENALSRYNLVDGFIDEFEDETGIDTGSSSNQTYDASEDKYSPEEIPAGIDANTVLMLHCDGTDGSTTFTDSSDSPHTVTANGDAQIDTAQSKFGGASGLFDGTGDYLTVPDSADWDFGTGDFTIDCWVRFSVLPSAGEEPIIIRQREGLSNIWGLSVQNSGGQLRYRVISRVGGSVLIDYNRDTTLSSSTWHHIALVRNGTIFLIFQDGVQVGTTETSSATLPNASSVLGVGADTDASDGFLNGNIDELRISKGVARWTANFTPPSSAYTDSSTIRNMELISEPVVAEEAPTQGRIYVLMEEDDAVTLNTDLKAFISRDDGANYQEVTLEYDGTFTGNIKFLSAVDDFGGTSDTDIVWKLTTHNEKLMNIHGVGMIYD